MSVLKEAKFKKCGECGNRNRVSEEVRGCDVCKKVFGDDEPYLSADIFRRDESGADRLDCCSWDCALKGLASVETDYFVSLPYLHYDSDTPVGQRASDFFAAIGKFNVPEAGRGGLARHDSEGLSSFQRKSFDSE